MRFNVVGNLRLLLAINMFLVWLKSAKPLLSGTNQPLPRNPGRGRPLFSKETSMSVFKPSRFTLAVAVTYYGEKCMALYNTLTEAFTLVEESDWHTALVKGFSAFDDEQRRILGQQGIIVAERVDETALWESWNQERRGQRQMVKSKTLVTRKCPLRCTYCIIAPEAGEMSADTALAVDRFYLDMIRRVRPESVRDNFLGGEPLLKAPLVLESARRRHYFCEGAGIDFGFTITTNGVLLEKKMVQQLKEVGLNGLQVSLAGPAVVHDKLRPTRSGGQSYAKIIKNLKSVSGQVPIYIECQYDAAGKDYRKIPEMLDDFKRHDIAVSDINFAAILPRRHDNIYTAGIGDPGKFLFLIQEARRRGYAKQDQGPRVGCMADMKNVLVFDVDGAIMACPSLQSGEYVYGNAETGIDFVAESQILKRRLPGRCLDQCSLLPVCGGGCRLMALTNNGDFNGIDCHYDTYRMLMEDYIQIRALSVLSNQEPAVNLDAA